MRTSIPRLHSVTSKATGKTIRVISPLVPSEARRHVICFGTTFERDLGAKVEGMALVAWDRNRNSVYRLWSGDDDSVGSTMCGDYVRRVIQSANGQN